MTRISRVSRLGLPALALALALGGGWAAVETFRARVSPAAFADRGGLGPDGLRLVSAAREQLSIGVAALNDRSLPAGRRLETHREHLKRAETLLVAALAARPTQLRALALLTAVRWELDPPRTPEAVEAHLRRIERSASMAPAAAEVQRDMGKLLLEMDRPTEARALLGRAVALRPALAGEVVDILRERGRDALEIHATLPGGPEGLTALRGAFFDEGLEGRFIELAEALGPASDLRLLRAWAAAHQRLGSYDRLRRGLEAAGALADPAMEAERQAQLSRAWLGTGAATPALEHAARAIALDPSNFSRSENLGQIALLSGDGDRAGAAFRDALGKAARGAVNPAYHARLYRQIGQAEELARHMDRAYDAYRTALSFDPDERHARRRIAELEAAAGIH